MKSIIAFALLAFVVSANPMTLAVNEFANTLGWTTGSTQANHVHTCLARSESVVRSMITLASEVQTNPSKAFVDASLTYPRLRSIPTTTCGPVMNDLQVYIATNGNGYSSRTNFAIYAAYTSQEMANLFLNVARGDATQVGASLANLFIIAVGAETREPITPTVLTVEQANTLNQQLMTLLTDSEALRELLQAELTPLGFDDTQIEALVSLFSNYEQVVEAVVTLVNGIQNGDSMDSVAAVQDFVDFVTQFLSKNQEGVNVLVQVNSPVVNALIANPAQVIAEITFNYLANMPEYIESSNALVEALLEGNWTEAGTIAVQINRLILGFLDN